MSENVMYLDIHCCFVQVDKGFNEALYTLSLYPPDPQLLLDFGHHTVIPLHTASIHPKRNYMLYILTTIHRQMFHIPTTFPSLCPFTTIWTAYL